MNCFSLYSDKIAKYKQWVITMRIKVCLIIIFTFTCVVYSYGGKVIEGYASWYGKAFHGRKTASGEIYNMHSLTGAHRTLPFGTYVKVVNLDNNRSVVIKINDRGPFKANRIIDVSKEAAIQLKFINSGLAKVRVILLGKRKSDNKFINPNTAVKRSANRLKKAKKQNSKSRKIFVIKIYEPIIKLKKPHYKLQIGAFYNIEHAIERQQKLLKMGIPSFISFYHKDSKVFRLLTKKTFNSKAKAQKAKEYVNKLGITAIIKKL